MSLFESFVALQEGAAEVVPQAEPVPQPSNWMDLARDSILVLGPLLGVCVGQWIQGRREKRAFERERQSERDRHLHGLYARYLHSWNEASKALVHGAPGAIDQQTVSDCMLELNCTRTEIELLEDDSKVLSTFLGTGDSLNELVTKARSPQMISPKFKRSLFDEMDSVYKSLVSVLRERRGLAKPGLEEPPDPGEPASAD